MKFAGTFWLKLTSFDSKQHTSIGCCCVLCLCSRISTPEKDTTRCRRPLHPCLYHIINGLSHSKGKAYQSHFVSTPAIFARAILSCTNGTTVRPRLCRAPGVGTSGHDLARRAAPASQPAWQALVNMVDHQLSGQGACQHTKCEG